MVGTDGGVDSDIVLNRKPWSTRLSTKIWAYSTTIFLVSNIFFSLIVSFGPQVSDSTWVVVLPIYSVVTLGGLFLAWALACYAEAFAINSLRKERLNDGIQSNGDKFLITFWFISALLLLVPVTLMAVLIIKAQT